MAKKSDNVIGPDACVRCNTLLTTSLWNSVMDISYCDNPQCSLYHQPVKNEKPFAERVGTSSATIKARLSKMRAVLFERDDD